MSFANKCCATWIGLVLWIISPVDRACIARAADPASADKESAARIAKEREQKNKEIARWEDLILFYGDEEDGTWSLRIDDKSVKERAWFEFLELWQYVPKEGRWKQIPTEKFSKPIVLPNTKRTDEPEGNQMLYKLEEIPPKTAGVWYAKWRVDNTIEGATLMRVGNTHPKTAAPADAIPSGMMRLFVPVTLEKGEWMVVPDPRTYCVKGGAGKPEK